MTSSRAKAIQARDLKNVCVEAVPDTVENMAGKAYTYVTIAESPDGVEEPIFKFDDGTNDGALPFIGSAI